MFPRPHFLPHTGQPSEHLQGKNHRPESCPHPKAASNALSSLTSSSHKAEPAIPPQSVAPSLPAEAGSNLAALVIPASVQDLCLGPPCSVGGVNGSTENEPSKQVIDPTPVSNPPHQAGVSSPSTPNSVLSDTIVIHDDRDSSEVQRFSQFKSYLHVFCTVDNELAIDIGTLVDNKNLLHKWPIMATYTDEATDKIEIRVRPLEYDLRPAHVGGDRVPREPYQDFRKEVDHSDIKYIPPLDGLYKAEITQSLVAKFQAARKHSVQQAMQGHRVFI